MSASAPAAPSFAFPSATAEGIQLTVIPVRNDAVIGAMSLLTLLQLVPDPKKEESKQALKYASGAARRHAELRALVQRTLTTQKGKNVTTYAAYIASGISGKNGAAWSLPPVTLWLDGMPAAIGAELVDRTGICPLTLTPGSSIVAIDGETQVTAWHLLHDDPERFGITYADLGQVRIPFELYFGLSVADARQIFYDRNVEGVPVAKNLAMSMDQRDLGTQITHRVADAVRVEDADGKIIPFSKLVQARKRQLSKSDPEVVLLSALRVLVITALHGRPGLALTSATIHDGKLPDGVDADQVQRELVPLLTRLISHLYPHFAARDAVTTPAVLAGLGIAAHQAVSWAGDAHGRLSADELLRLLDSVRFERDARYWDGVAASANAAGTLNFGGGAKDAGGRVADALLRPDSEYGRKIRGW
ncbi:DNA sulfur modification protein DndB [Streptomyces sp. Q6]|uniref:DNA sulfur modification protein DndB n=1 Tax=Streptomyces citrinus TaxID=3118173 RepID=A0ACD5AKN2_9ACTN